MPRTKKTKITGPQKPAVTEPQVGRLTGAVLELHGQHLKEELLANSNNYNLNRDQVEGVCKVIDAITIKSKDAALRQVISIFQP
tara:strand:- start:840 stop:1091 length:252 start_codon:yes stop_codon:yes gene_type:complete